MADVTVYSTPECPVCRRVKSFLEENSVEYRNIDVSADKEKANEMMEKSGQMGVPVVVIGGDVLVQPSNEQLKKALKLE